MNQSLTFKVEFEKCLVYCSTDSRLEATQLAATHSPRHRHPDASVQSTGMQKDPPDQRKK